MSTWDTFNAIHAELDAQRPQVEEPPEVTERRVRYYRNNRKAKKRFNEKQRRAHSSYRSDPPRPGEIPLGQFLALEAKRTGLHKKTIYGRWINGDYGAMPQRRVNQRAVYVIPNL